LGNYSLQNTVGGYLNTGIGVGSLQNVNSGNKNVAVGYIAGNSITNGSNNTLLGSYSDALDGVINSTAIGANAIVTTSNQIVLGTSSENVLIPGNILLNGLVRQF